jgi:hypothetical protein
MTIRTAGQSKGIFCIEGNWVKDLRMPQTVRPLLNLLLFNANIPYIHRDCATKTELEFYLGKWVLKKYAAYPILYLASHGEQFGILLDEGNYSLDQIAECLEGRCEHRIILIASCSTLNVNLKLVKRFLQSTGALALCGYRTDVPWMRSTAFELLLLHEMQGNEFSGRGIDAIARKLRLQQRAFRDLEFRIVTLKDLS